MTKVKAKDLKPDDRVLSKSGVIYRVGKVITTGDRSTIVWYSGGREFRRGGYSDHIMKVL